MKMKDQKEKLRKQSHFDAVASKIIKYLGTNLPKEVEDLKATWRWWKKAETDGKTHHVLGLGETMLWKWLHHSRQYRLKAIYRLKAAAAKSLQSCPTLCNPTDGSPSGSPTPGILQARTLEWVAISFSNAWKWKVKVKLLSRVWLLVTPWTAAYQAPPSMGFSKQEYWSGVPLPSPRLKAIPTR